LKKTATKAQLQKRRTGEKSRIIMPILWGKHCAVRGVRGGGRQKAKLIVTMSVEDRS